MEKIGIFYGSSTGNTEKVADLILNLFGDEAMSLNVEDATAEDVAQFPYLIFGVSTWEIGEMQDDWQEFLEELSKVDLAGKKVAIFGLGDQEAYGESFGDAVAKVYDIIAGKATVVGQWPLDGYDFVESEAVKDGMFMGLMIDEDNQKEMTAGRVKAWVEILKKEFV